MQDCGCVLDLLIAALYTMTNPTTYIYINTRRNSTNAMIAIA